MNQQQVERGKRSPGLFRATVNGEGRRVTEQLFPLDNFK